MCGAKPQTGIGEQVFDQSGEKSLADDFEYVMHGKIYKKDEADSMTIFISFGGLLLKLVGPDKWAIFQGNSVAPATRVKSCSSSVH